MAQHKWHKEIKAWADGAEIEMWYGDRWEQVHHIPEWNMEAEFRIKPQPKEPKYLYVYQNMKDEYKFSDSKFDSINIFKYIGKIKLEDDDA